MDITYILQAGGVLGLLVLGVGIMLGILGCVLIFSARNRSTFLIYGTTSLLPLLMGLFGTWVGYREIRSFLVSTSITASPEVLEEGYRAAWVTTYLGMAFSVVILVVACAGLCIQKALDSTAG